MRMNFRGKIFLVGRWKIHRQDDKWKENATYRLVALTLKEIGDYGKSHSAQSQWVEKLLKKSHLSIEIFSYIMKLF